MVIMTIEVIKNYESLKDLIKLIGYKTYLRPIKLSSGIKTKYYFDIRKVLGFVNGLHFTANIFIHDMQENYPYIDSVCGIETGGISIASAIHLMSPKILTWCYVRRKRKSWGLKTSIDGVIGNKNKVLLFDDVLTTGQSTLNAIETLEESKVSVEGIYVILDRLEGGTEILKEHGYKLKSLFTVDDFL